MRVSRGYVADGRYSSFWTRAFGAVASVSIVASGLAASPASAALPTNCTQSGVTVECTFNYTGSSQTWTVPAGVASAAFDLYGASGGDMDATHTGGDGARVQATLSVTPADAYAVVVGQEGFAANPGTPNSAYNGGGAGRTYPDGEEASLGGGGATDVRLGGASLAERILVAGGGGGAANSGSATIIGGNQIFWTGGAGGSSAEDGASGTTVANAQAGSGGGAGGAAAGGTGGVGYDSVFTSTSDPSTTITKPAGHGSDGQLGQGGAGGAADEFVAGGGGGGGYYGGGGGAGGSYTDPGTPPKTAQSITFNPTASGTAGGSQTLSASATSNLTVSFSIDATSGSGVCSLAGDGVTLNYLAAGTCVVNADQAGDATYEAAPQVTKSVTVAAAKLAQVITFANPGTQNFGTNPTLTATSDSNLPVSFSSSTTGVCTITTGGSLTTVSAGTCTINADQAGNDTYEAATQVTRSFTIAAVVPGAPTIGTATAGDASASVTFTAPASNGGASINEYTATSTPGGLTGTCTSSPCTVNSLTNGTEYTFTVTATNTVGTGQPSASSNAVTPKGQQTIIFTPAGTGTVGASQALVATASSGLDVTFTLDASSDAGACDLAGTTLTYLAAGTCVINADQAGNNAYVAAVTVTKSVDVDVATFTTGPTATISGTARQGQTLTAHVGSPVPTPSSYTYRWFADGTEISGQTAKTLLLTSAHVGKKISVEVTAHKTGYDDASDTSPPTAAVLGNFTTGPTATISGTVRQGQTLTAHVGSPVPTPSSYTYRWFADGTEITGQTAKTLSLTSAQVGKRILVRVTAHRAGYVSSSDNSPQTVPVVGIFTPGPTASISGTPRVGSTLTANAGSPSPTPTSLGYQWLVDDHAITGANGRTFTLTPSFVGKQLQVRVYASKPGYVTSSGLSAPTSPISNLQAKTISLELNDYTVNRGQRVYANIELLAPGEPWSVVLDGKRLATGYADTKGVANAAFVIPADANLGIRTIDAYGRFADRLDHDRITIR